MRLFIVFCIAAVAKTELQGYNYTDRDLNQLRVQQIPNERSIHSFSQTPTNSHITNSNTNYNQPSFKGHEFLQQFLSNPNLEQKLLAPKIPKQQIHHSNQFSSPPLAPVVTKDIYLHTAPEEPEETYYESPVSSLPPRKHYRIVFIKAPTQKISPAALRLAQAKTEEKTIIYVLTQKQDPLDLQKALQEIKPTQPSKPEVYFIKYKTQEEAAHAQKTIQEQFDSLGGSSQLSDEGVAPVTSVIGSLSYPNLKLTDSERARIHKHSDYSSLNKNNHYIGE